MKDLYYDFINSCLEEVDIFKAHVKLSISIIKLTINEYGNISNLQN